MDGKVGRRDFIASSAKIAVACCFLPQALEAYAGAATAADGGLEISLESPENAALKTPGGAIFLNAGPESKTIIVWRESASSVKAFSSACTHKGVKIGLPDSSGVMQCPAHGARFDKDGHAIKGPAKKDIAVYPCQLNGSTIKIAFNPA